MKLQKCDYCTITSSIFLERKNETRPFLANSRKVINLSVQSFFSQNHKTKKFTHKSKAYAGSTGPKVNSASMLYAAKHNDYERVKILFRYGYRWENDYTHYVLIRNTPEVIGQICFLFLKNFYALPVTFF